MENAIEITGLEKTYRATRKSPEYTALHGVDLTIPKGAIYGLLGPNGAGKSTMINIMAGLVTKTAGTVKIWDIDIDKGERHIKTAIGVVPQEVNFDSFFTPKQTLDIQGGMYGVPYPQRRTAELLELMGLTDKAKTFTRGLSGGMKRRLMVAKAMVHNPPILILDEPTAGVDVELRRQLWNNVRKLNQNGTTVLLTTHYLEEAEELCNRIAIIHQGKIVADDDKETLLARINQKEIIFRLDRPITVIPPGLEDFHASLQGEKRSLRCCYSPGDDVVNQMIEILQKAGYGIADISTDESDLEDVFLQLTSH